MGVRFVSLDSKSLKLVRCLVERNLAEGGTAFDVDQPQSPAG